MSAEAMDWRQKISVLEVFCGKQSMRIGKNNKRFFRARYGDVQQAWVTIYKAGTALLRTFYQAKADDRSFRALKSVDGTNGHLADVVRAGPCPWGSCARMVECFSELILEIISLRPVGCDDRNDLLN